MPKKPQNTISQTAIKYFNEFRSVRTKALKWVKIATDTRMKLKVERTFKGRYQQLLDFITIDVLNIEQKHTSSQYIINLPMTTIINSSLNKHPMPWKLVHCLLLHPSDIVMK